MTFGKSISVVGMLGLTACVGTFLSGDEPTPPGPIPDLRTVPPRAEAMASRGWHGAGEKGHEDVLSQEDAQALQSVRASLGEEDQATRARIRQLKQKEGAS